MSLIDQDALIKASIHKLYKGDVVKAYSWMCEPNLLFFGYCPYEMAWLGKNSLVLAKLNEFLGEGNEIRDVEKYWESVQQG